MPISDSYCHQMTQCRCGAMFRASGDLAHVQRKFEEWEKQHRDCAEPHRPAAKIFWMSFCDGDRPEGQQFLGACIISVSAAEAEDCMVDMLLRFPFAQPDAEWIAAATKKAWALGCNPGGEIATHEIPPDHPMLAHYTQGILMDRETIERIDAEIEKS